MAEAEQSTANFEWIERYRITAGDWPRRLLLRHDRRTVLHRGPHVRRILGVDADEGQVFLLRRPSMLARFGGLTEHELLRHLVAVFAGDPQRLEIRVCLSFVAG